VIHRLQLCLSFFRYSTTAQLYAQFIVRARRIKTNY